MRIIFVLIILSNLFSCEKKTDGWVVEYGDEILTVSEIKKIVPQGIDKDDSLSFVNDVIEKWAKDKVLLNSAQEILDEEEINLINIKVTKYKEDITTSFIEEKLSKSIDTTISDEEIKGYYESYKDGFILTEDYISYHYMQIPKDSAESYKKLLRNEKYDLLEKKLKSANFPYELSEENWIAKEKLLSTDFLPENIKKQNLNIKNQIFTSTTNDKMFVLEIVDFKKSGDYSPIAVVKNTIKNVLINKRKLNLLSQKKNELYQKALNNDEIKRK